MLISSVADYMIYLLQPCCRSMGISAYVVVGEKGFRRSLPAP